MRSMEQRSQTIERRSNLEQQFAQQFEQLYVHNNLCFRKQDGVIFSLCAFPEDAAIVVEYAVNFEEANLNRFEDGDLFYLEDMDEETMFHSMLEEIGQ